MRIGSSSLSGSPTPGNDSQKPPWVDSVGSIGASLTFRTSAATCMSSSVAITSTSNRIRAPPTAHEHNPRERNSGEVFR